MFEARQVSNSQPSGRALTTLRAGAIEHLQDAEEQLQKRISAEATAAEYAATLDSAPAETQRLRATLDEAAVSPTAEDFGMDAYRQ